MFEGKIALVTGGASGMLRACMLVERIPHSRSYATRICIGNNLTRKVLQNSSKKIWRVGRASCLPSKL